MEFLTQNDIEKVRDQEASDREDPDLEKSGRLLNRVIEWNRDGTIETDQRHVREILKGLEFGATESLCDTVCHGDKG